MELADELEIAEAKDTIFAALDRLAYLRGEGRYKPRSVWSVLLGGPRPLPMPPIPVSPSAVRRAEEVLAAHGIEA